MKTKKYLASEWLLMVHKGYANFASAHEEASWWYWLVDGRYGKSTYKNLAHLAESAEASDRAIGLKPVRRAPV